MTSLLFSTTDYLPELEERLLDLIRRCPQGIRTRYLEYDPVELRGQPRMSVYSYLVRLAEAGHIEFVRLEEHLSVKSLDRLKATASQPTPASGSATDQAVSPSEEPDAPPQNG